MAASVRRRLFAIALLAALVCVGAVGTLWHLARTSAVQRAERGREAVTGELERLGEVVAAIPVEARASRGRRGLAALHSGWVANPDSPGPGSPVVRAVLKDAAESGQEAVTVAARPDGTPIVAGAAPAPGGGLVWAALLTETRPEEQTFRVVVLLLVLVSLALVAGTLQTGVVLARGVTSLRHSLSALGKDLGAPIARPAMRELGEIADGAALLATELRRAQDEHDQLTRQLAERERLAALGRVVAGVAHEVRNPLAAIKLRADLALAATEASSALGKDLGEISLEVARLDRLVADLLVVTGTSKKVGPRATVDLGALAQKRVELLAPWAKERGVSLFVEGRAEANVDGDAVSRALDNLLRNAVEASPSGAAVDITVAGDDTEARLSVFDHGGGVPATHEAELFEPFFTTKSDGTGLGLALSRAIAAAHGGTLLYSRQGDVTRFTLTLPRLP